MGLLLITESGEGSYDPSPTWPTENVAYYDVNTGRVMFRIIYDHADGWLYSAFAAFRHHQIYEDLNAVQLAELFLYLQEYIRDNPLCLYFRTSSKYSFKRSELGATHPVKR